ncbi:MAG: signal peptidase I [Bernardetiaceae bacterium]|nr:signal peptidase I [Bernardetiaceae bacterium]
MEESGGILGLIIQLGFFVLYAASFWKIYEKAGHEGWKAIIPIYNLVILLQIINKPVWWLLLLLIPVVNIVILFMMYIELAKVFGKGVGYGIGLVLLSFIFAPMLAFGDAQYQGAGGVFNNSDTILD